MFVLIPLLSSSVVAFTSESTCDSENNEDGPVVSVTIPPGPYPIRYYDEPPRTAIFKLHYTFVDTDGEGEGSEHYAILYIEKSHPVPDSFNQNTGIQFLNPGESWQPQTLQKIDTWTEDDYCYWHVHVTIACRQLPDGDWVEDSDNYVVVVD